MALSENILIVEDEDEWCGIYNRAVDSRRSDQRIRIAKDLAGAKRLIDSVKFAVAFVDVGLDVSDDRNVDGLRVMEWIRAAGDETSIIVVTGRSGQDVLTITRDAIKKYDAYDTVGKSTVEPSEIRRLLDEGLQAYRKAVPIRRLRAREALRGDMDGMRWDDAVMRALHFRQGVGPLYDFLDDLLGEYLPVISRHLGGNVIPDPSSGMAYAEYWSRAIGCAVAVCFGQEDGFERAISECSNGMPLDSSIGQASTEGLKGAIFSLDELRREDFHGDSHG